MTSHSWRNLTNLYNCQTTFFQYICTNEHLLNELHLVFFLLPTIFRIFKSVEDCQVCRRLVFATKGK